MNSNSKTLSMRHKIWRDKEIHFPSWPDGGSPCAKCSTYGTKRVLFPLIDLYRKAILALKARQEQDQGLERDREREREQELEQSLERWWLDRPTRSHGHVMTPISLPRHSCPGVYELASLVYGSSFSDLSLCVSASLRSASQTSMWGH